MAMTKKAEREQQRDEAIAKLRALLPPGSVVPVILRHVSRSGMTRAISPIINGEDYSWLVARAMGNRVHQNHGGIIVGGCGMDMGFHLIYSLSRTLYADGFACIGQSADGGYSGGCPSNDHTNERYRDSSYDPARVHSDGGYALRHRWL